MSIKFLFAWYDLWVGAFVDVPRHKLYVFPLPCLGFVISFPTGVEWTAWKYRWLPLQRIRNERGDIVLSRLKLVPATRWGQLYLHKFHDSEHGMPHHDHPYDFWTIPSKDYVEEVRAPFGYVFRCVLPRLRVSRRRAEHSHVVVGPRDGKFPFYTLFWQGPQRRRWGFWTNCGGSWTDCGWVYWKDYLADVAARRPKWD